MPELSPFRGIRYSSHDLRDLVCPPYDVISPDDQARLHRRHPHNAVHLELARGHEKYRKTAETFKQWLSTDVLRQDDVPSLYVYRQDFRDQRGRTRRVAGVIGALRLEPWGPQSGVVPHERTMPGPIEDRLALMRACPLNISPIYAIYRGRGAVASFFESLERRVATVRLEGDDGALHRMWAIRDEGEMALLSAALRPGPLVIADGHHRYETALAFHAEQAGQPGGHDAVMCFCVDADVEDLLVLPYHRAARAPLDGKQLHKRLLDLPNGVPLVGADPLVALEESPADHAYAFVLEDGDLLIEMSREEVGSRVPHGAPAWRALDVVALHEAVLPEVFPEGIQELRFSTDVAEIVRLVRREDWTAGILLRPLHAAQVVEVAKAGERLPQKASYFWPKVLTGLVFRSLGRVTA